MQATAKVITESLLTYLQCWGVFKIQVFKILFSYYIYTIYYLNI